MNKDNIVLYRKSNFLYIANLRCMVFLVFFTKNNNTFFMHTLKLSRIMRKTFKSANFQISTL